MLKNVIASLFLFSQIASAGLPPTSTKGQSDAAKSTTFDFQAPYYQFAKTSGTAALLDTGNANLLPDGGFEGTTMNWSAYADAASATPVDMTGGAPTVTCTRTTTTPLAGTGSFLITKDAANRQGEGCSIPLTIPTKAKGKVIQVQFNYAIASGTFADNDIDFYIYDVTNAAIIQPAPYHLKNHSLAADILGLEFQSSSSSTSYRIGFHVASTSSSAYTVKVDDISVGQQAKLYGSPVTDWVSYTPTGTWSTNTTYTGKWRRVGDNMEVSVKVATSGAPTSANLNVNLPSGFTIDTSKLNTAAFTEPLGSLLVNDSDVVGYQGWVSYTSTTAVSFKVVLAATPTQFANLTQAVPMTFGAGDSVGAEFRVPIVGWSSSVIMSSDANNQVIAATYISNAGESITANVTNIPFATKLIDTTGSWSGSVYTVPVAGNYQVSTTVTNNAGASLALDVYKNGSQYIRLGADQASNQIHVGSSVVIPCVAGDTLAIRSNTTITLTTSTLYHWVSISKLSGPAQIAASDNVSALYTGAPPTGTLNSSYNITTFGTKVKDTHNAYSSGSYTVPVSGTYSISAGTRQNATYALNTSANLAIFIDGTQSYTNGVVAAAAISAAFPLVSVNSVPLLAGQVVTIRSLNDATSPTFQSSANQNFFSIVRTGNY